MTRLANAFFLVLFPGLFLYHLAVALTGIPLLLGSLWSPANIAACAFLGAGTLAHLLRGKVSWKPFFLVVALTAIVAAYAIYFRLYGVGYQASWQPFEESVKVVIGWTALLLIGFWLKPNEVFLKLLFGSWVVMTISTLALMDMSSIAFVASEQLDARVASYHWFAQSYVVTATAILAFYPRSIVRYVVMTISLPIVFILSSRGELLGYLVVVVVFGLAYLLIYRSAPEGKDCSMQGMPVAVRWRRLWLVSLVFLTSIVGIATWVTLVPQIGPERTAAVVGNLPSDLKGHDVGPATSQNRQLQLLSGTDDAGTSIRLWSLKKGLEDIAGSPFSGSYAGQMEWEGSFGHYIHNVFSVWHAYGIIAFVIYLYLTVTPFLYAARRLSMGAYRPQIKTFLLMLSAYSLALVVVAKSVYWPIPALAWGLYISVQRIADPKRPSLVGQIENTSSQMMPPTKKTQAQ